MAYPGISNVYSRTHSVEGAVIIFSQSKDVWQSFEIARMHSFTGAFKTITFSSLWKNFQSQAKVIESTQSINWVSTKF